MSESVSGDLGPVVKEFVETFWFNNKEDILDEVKCLVNYGIEVNMAISYVEILIHKQFLSMQECTLQDIIDMINGTGFGKDSALRR